MNDRFALLPSGIELCYRTRGDTGARPLLLIAGLAQDLTTWAEPLLDRLAAAGFFVIHHDNRDIGRSTKMSAAPRPTPLQLLRGRPIPGAYGIADMTNDASALLDHLGIDTVDLVGQSMGGMIAQSLAVAEPRRTRSLVSIYSTTGQKGVGGAAWSTVARLGLPPARDRDQFVRRHVALIRHLAGSGYPMDETLERAYVENAWDRAGGIEPAGIARQILAVQTAADRTAELNQLGVPTLVIHGDRDRIVHPSGGRATAAAIPGARSITIPGMGHHLAPGLLSRLCELITEHCGQNASR
ncbi:alpha/beta fold hydrolase [Nocardia testacea]|uniref:alpha/beta fold hydrolase n=1 Tax=Nocardia testacea TaxID=248551 RepID=UPI003C2EB7B6